jgi:NADH-quinone oxidoreductase subunit C
VLVPEDDPFVSSVESLWKTANWHEREAYDLVGVKFRGHPDLRRILTPQDWEGHPLRKDYKQQESYHNVSTGI